MRAPHRWFVSCSVFWQSEAVQSANSSVPSCSTRSQLPLSNDASNVRDERRNGGGERDENASESRNRDSDALLGGMDEVAETFQQGFQDFLTALQERPLREHIGHTPVQVLAGGVLGVVVGTAYALALRGEAGAR